MCALDHETLRNTGLCRHSCENLLEYAALAPADEPVVYRILYDPDPLGVFLLLQAVTDHINGPADDPTVIHTA